MTEPPGIAGYAFTEHVYDGDLGEIWLGRTSATGPAAMAVALLILTEAGAADPEVRHRFAESGRSVPLWAASYTAARPYQLVRLVPGQTGAIALLDPLRAMLGDTDADTDTAALAELRQRLLHPSVPRQTTHRSVASGNDRTDAGTTRDAGARDTLEAAEGKDGTEDGAEDGSGRGRGNPLDEVHERLGRQAWFVVAVFAACLGCMAYATGWLTRDLATGSAPAADGPSGPAVVSPSRLPAEVVLPGIGKVPDAVVRDELRPVSVVGPTYTASEHAEPVTDLGLPFAFRWPAGSAGTISLGESSYAIYRRVIAGQDPNGPPLDLRIAAHPCATQQACLAERREFDTHWTRRLGGTSPRTPKDPRTWFTEAATADGAYQLSMTRIFIARGKWWLVGAVMTADQAQRASAQKVMNDIRTQTP